ncbi:uncharacterized protein BX664DRAFT_340890 [Halteromyces radiatus]|uniref:uncharacterized protein n=1 Tax=Halteromyces radiatus TaxID=101107 RepID=UPI00221F000D|nr:uncharacterized protein BX664DRAFT_340890 [Halteromyces radiatus]KAI8081633.1 hypothetical protein BX664DRAFT_340890 [Halteromyces radiatus]
MGDANDVMQLYSGRVAYHSAGNNFYDYPTKINHTRRRDNIDNSNTNLTIPLHMTTTSTTRQNTYRTENDRHLPKSLTSIAMNVVFDLASGVKLRYTKSPTSTPDLQNDMYIYHRASDESKETQYIPSPPNSQRPKNTVQQMHHRYTPNVVTPSYRSSQQQTRFLTQNRFAKRTKHDIYFNHRSNSNRHQSCATIKQDLENFKPPMTWSRLPRKRHSLKEYHSPTIITMNDVVNKLKEEMERYTYLLDDAEKTMKDYESDIEDTLEQLQALDNKIKDMNIKTASYSERQSSMNQQLEALTVGSNIVKTARIKQRKLDGRIDKWKGERDPMQQLSFILTAHERIEKLDRYTRVFWDISFYVVIVAIILIISLLSIL